MKIRSDRPLIVNESLKQIGVQFRAKENHRTAWFAVFECKCGSREIMRIHNAERGQTCLVCFNKRQKGRPADWAKKHGKTGSKVYLAWADMKDRCLNKNNKAFHRYGGRGIFICEEWMDFVPFYEDMGDPPEGYQLERIENDKGYSKDNCKWATIHEQRRNTSATIRITHSGKTMCLSDWADHLGIGKHNLLRRMKKMSFEEAISFPVKKYKTRRPK